MRLSGVALITALVCLGLTHLQAQAAAFDVVSIRPGKPGTPRRLRLENNRFTADTSLFGLIVYAWDLMPSPARMDAMLAHVPKWVSTESFAIQAVAEGNPTEDQMRFMMRAMLADRFQLQVHTVTEQTPVLALIPDKPGVTGSKLRPHSEGQACDVHIASPMPAVGAFPAVCEQLMAIPAAHGAIIVAARDVSIEKIATFVSSLGILTRPVVDQTGLSGRFDFMIEFTPERKGPAPSQDVQPDDFQVTTLQEALPEQLGLKLKTTTAPLDTLVVDHAGKPSEN